jgi:UDP-glucose 4-epimerase
MKVLVTGAAGFLGRSVVSALLDRSHDVRVVLRPSTRLETLAWGHQVEVFRADLRSHPDLVPAFDGIDAVVHLAAAMAGGEAAMFAGTVTATERLLDAMARTQTRRLVLASSYAVYDWSAIHGHLDEESPVEQDLYARDPYAVAKVWQERVALRASDEHGWELTVLRPGYIWGTGGEWLYGIGQRAGPLLAVVAPCARLPLTHVSNCADCFAAVVADPRSTDRTYNVIDGHALSTWAYAARYRRWTGGRTTLVPVPYGAGMLAARTVSGAVSALARRPARLPGLLVPGSFEARFKPLQHSNARLEAELGWRPPYDLATCLEATFGGPAPFSPADAATWAS